MRKGYACGFLFSPDQRRVLLIRKRRPNWQIGKLNGVGGKLEPGETAAEAMRREFREEAGLDIATWQPVVMITGIDWQTYFFRAFGDIDVAYAVTDEQLERHHVDQLPDDVIPNLHWMIPMMLDVKVTGGEYAVTVMPGLP